MPHEPTAPTRETPSAGQSNLLPARNVNGLRLLLGLPPLQPQPQSAATPAVNPAAATLAAQIAPSVPSPQSGQPMTDWLQAGERWIAEEMAAAAAERTAGAAGDASAHSVPQREFTQEHRPTQETAPTIPAVVQPVASRQMPLVAAPQQVTPSASPTDDPTDENQTADEPMSAPSLTPAPVVALTTIEIPGQVATSGALPGPVASRPIPTPQSQPESTQRSAETVPVNRERPQVETPGALPRPVASRPVVSTPAPPSQPEPTQRSVETVPVAKERPQVEVPAANRPSTQGTDTAPHTPAAPQPTAALPTSVSADRQALVQGMPSLMGTESAQPIPTPSATEPSVREQSVRPQIASTASATLSADLAPMLSMRPAVAPVAPPVMPVSTQATSSLPQPAMQAPEPMRQTPLVQPPVAEPTVKQEALPLLQPAHGEHQPPTLGNQRLPSQGERAARSMEELRKQVDALRAKITVLEKEQQSAPPPVSLPPVIVRNPRPSHSGETRAFWARSYRSRARLRI